jgi:hypothetical protein
MVEGLRFVGGAHERIRPVLLSLVVRRPAVLGCSMSRFGQCPDWDWGLGADRGHRISSRHCFPSLARSRSAWSAAAARSCSDPNIPSAPISLESSCSRTAAAFFAERRLLASALRDMRLISACLASRSKRLWLWR